MTPYEYDHLLGALEQLREIKGLGLAVHTDVNCRIEAAIKAIERVFNGVYRGRD